MRDMIICGIMAVFIVIGAWMVIDLGSDTELDKEKYTSSAQASMYHAIMIPKEEPTEDKIEITDEAGDTVNWTQEGDYLVIDNDSINWEVDMPLASNAVLREADLALAEEQESLINWDASSADVIEFSEFEEYASITFTEESAFVFTSTEKDLLRIEANGDFYVEDRLTTNDMEVYEAIKEFYLEVFIVGNRIDIEEVE